MRSIKMLSFAAFAAMALIAAPSAMAGSTALCKANQTPCVGGNLIAQIHAVAVNPEFKQSAGGDVTCEKSLLKASVLTLGSPQIAHIEELTWTNCEQEEEPCEVINLTAGLISFLKENPNLASAKFSGDKFLIQCDSSMIDCIFGGEPVFHGLGSDLPANAGLITAAEIELPKIGGFLCAFKNKYVAKYEFLEDVFFTT
jgi:hypothetical protein